MIESVNRYPVPEVWELLGASGSFRDSLLWGASGSFRELPGQSAMARSCKSTSWICGALRELPGQSAIGASGTVCYGTKLQIHKLDLWSAQAGG